jgi:hypothetical protein
MAVWIEVAKPFVWKPKIERAAGFVGLMWGWVRVAHIAYDFNSFVQGLARVGRADAENSLSSRPLPKEKT